MQPSPEGPAENEGVGGSRSENKACSQSEDLHG